jgi:hypothetical protein
MDGGKDLSERFSVISYLVCMYMNIGVNHARVQMRQFLGILAAALKMVKE